MGRFFGGEKALELSRWQTKSLKLVGLCGGATCGGTFAIHAGVAAATPCQIVCGPDNPKKL
jgi:hypothetical protein